MQACVHFDNIAAMRRTDFHFDLPDSLIAQFPCKERTASRLLCLNGETGQVTDRQFTELLDLIQPGDLMVFNNTRVIPARLHGQKETGGKVEVLVERLLDEHQLLAHVRASKSPKAGQKLHLEAGIEAEVLGRDGELFQLRFISERTVLDLLESHGHLPLPPYIEREDQQLDEERYQTVYAAEKGAVAAPTAGLHFDQEMLGALQAKGVEFAYVTLHVGAGTFQPVRADELKDHVMHKEWLQLKQTVCDQVKATRERGGRVIAVGTTSVRSLESASQSGEIASFEGETNLFIYPGYKFVSVDAIVTNFHLPESTLLMLISAFAGQQQVLAAYQHAVNEQYRFFSYGDAMFITPKPNALKG